MSTTVLICLLTFVGLLPLLWVVLLVHSRRPILKVEPIHPLNRQRFPLAALFAGMFAGVQLVTTIANPVPQPFEAIFLVTNVLYWAIAATGGALYFRYRKRAIAAFGPDSVKFEPDSVINP